MDNKCVLLKLHLEELDKAFLQHNFQLQQLRTPEVKSREIKESTFLCSSLFPPEGEQQNSL